MTIFKKEHNVRDLGGIQTKDGHTIIEGYFIRSGGPYAFNAKELEHLKSLSIKTILDLRTKQECMEKPNPSLDGVETIQHSGLVSKGGEDIDFSPAGMNKIGNEGKEQLEKLRYYYQNMPYGNQAIALMFQYILEDKVPILIHCATGKDRTGIAIMCLLMALGVDKTGILDDYLLTNTYRKDNIEKALKQNQAIIEQYPERKELIQMKEGVSPYIGKLVLDGILSRYGTFETFLEKEYGIDATKRNTLKARYTR